MSLKIILTGSTGFVGQALVSCLKNKYEVLTLKNTDGLDWRLGDLPDLKQISESDFIIHLAWDMHTENKKTIVNKNIRGSLKLFKEVKKIGAKFLFISSISAVAKTKSKYGRSKYFVERIIQKRGGLILRPGLVWSEGSLGGVLGKIEYLIKTLPLIFIPVSPKIQVYMVHIDDLCNIISGLVLQKGNYNLNPVVADSKALTLIEIADTIAKKNSKNLFYLPLKIEIFQYLFQAFNCLPFSVKLRTDSIYGIIGNSTSIQQIVPYTYKQFS